MTHGNSIVFIIVALLLLVSVAYALPPELDEFLESTADAILKFFSELSRRLTFLAMIWTKIDVLKDEIYDNLPVYLLNDPPLNDPMISSIAIYFIRILQPFYILAIILTGMYLMFFSRSQRDRLRAKYMIFNLVVGIAIISLSLHIIGLLFDVSGALTQGILDRGPLNIGITYKQAIDYLQYMTADFVWIDVAVGIPLLIFAFFLTLGLFIILAARYFLLVFLTIFFPFAVFLGMFYPTRNIGQAIIRHLLLWIFLPVGYALALVIIAIGGKVLTTTIPEISDVVNLLGAFLLVISPLIIFGLMNCLGVFAMASAIFIGSLTPMVVLPTEPKTEAEQEEEEKPQEGSGTAVGMAGYNRAVSDGDELPMEKIKPLLRDMADMRGYILLEKIKENKRLYNSLVHSARAKRITLNEFVIMQYGFKITSKEGVVARTQYTASGAIGGIRPKVAGTTKPLAEVKISYPVKKEEKRQKKVQWGVLPKERIRQILINLSDVERNISLEEIQDNKRLYNSLAIDAKKKRMPFKRLIREEYGLWLVSEEKAKASRPTTTSGTKETSGLPGSQLRKSRGFHVSSRPVPHKIGDGKFIVAIPPGPASPSFNVNIPPGDTLTMDIVIKNDVGHDISRVTIYDEDLLSVGILIIYSENRFRLAVNEEKRVRVRITTKEELERKSYTGHIVVRTDENVLSIIDVRIDTAKTEKGEKSRWRLSGETDVRGHKGALSEKGASPGERKPYGAGTTLIHQRERPGGPTRKEPPLWEEEPKAKAKEKSAGTGMEEKPTGREAPMIHQRERPDGPAQEESLTGGEKPTKPKEKQPQEGTHPSGHTPQFKKTRVRKFKEGITREGAGLEQLELSKPAIMPAGLLKPTRLIKSKKGH